MDWRDASGLWSARVDEVLNFCGRRFGLGAVVGLESRSQRTCQLEYLEVNGWKRQFRLHLQAAISLAVLDKVWLQFATPKRVDIESVLFLFNM